MVRFGLTNKALCSVVDRCLQEHGYAYDAFIATLSGTGVTFTEDGSATVEGRCSPEELRIIADIAHALTQHG